MINFIKNIFKSKKPLYPTHIDITTPLTQEQYEFLEKTLNARPDYRASIEGKIIGERDSYKIRDALLRKISLTQKIRKDNNGIVAQGDVNITNQYTVDYVQQLEQELAIGKQEDGLTNARFNQIESTYEKAKHQNPNHPSVKTFVNIAREYYRQRISQAKKNGLNTSAYEDALQRYTQ